MKILNRLPIVAAAVLALTFAVLPVHAATITEDAEEERSTGSVEFQLKDLEAGNSKMGGVTITLYRVGDVDDYGRATLYAEYGGTQIPDDAAGQEQLSEQLAAMVSGSGYISGQTSDKGVLKLEGLEQGMYLAVFSGNSGYGEVDPLLLTFPFYDDCNGEITGPNWETEVEPKASAYPVKTEKETEPEETEGDNTTVETPPTGDNSNIAVWIVCAAAAVILVIVLIIIAVRSRRKGKYHEEEEE